MPIDRVPESTSIIISKDSRESTVPIVYFDRIELDTIDMATTARAIRTARRGVSPVRPERRPPRMTQQRQGLSDLAIVLKMHLELPINHASLSTDVDPLKHLNVIIMRSEDARISKAVETSGDLLIKKFINQAGYTKIYQGLLSDLNPKKIVIGAAEEAINKKTLDISFQLDDYPAHAKEHLSYYAMCYIEMKQDFKKDQQKLSSRGVSPAPPRGWRRPGPQIPGPISGENVFTAGQLNVTSYVYVVTSPFPKNLNGTYWTGPVIQDENGKWSSGMWTIVKGRPKMKSTKPPLDLDRISVRNSKIQDFRVVKQIPSLSISLRPDKFFPLTIEGKDTYNNFINNPDAYISMAFLSRDRHNNCKFMFEFDYIKFVSRESKFGKILVNPFVPESTKEKIYLYSRINSLQITRRQVEARRGYNRLVSPILGIYPPDCPPEVEIILETASNEKNNNLCHSIKSFAPGKSIGTLNDQVSGFMELPRSTLKFSPKETRTFLVTDNSVSQITDGTYQYGVKIEMEDGSVRFLNERLKGLQTIRGFLVGFKNLLQIPKTSYQTISSITQYYNRLFTKDPRRDARSILESTEINNLRTELGIPVGNLTPQDVLYPWIVAPEYFVDTLESISDFSPVAAPTHGSADLSKIRQTAQAKLASVNAKPGDIPGSFKKNLASRFAERRSSQASADPFNQKAARFALGSLLDPFTATPESVIEVIGLFDFLFQTIRERMGNSAYLDEPPDPIRKLGVSKNSKVSVLNLEDTFVELFDAQLSPMPSIDYIGFKGSEGMYQGVGGGTDYQTLVQAGTNVKDLATGATEPIEALDAGLDAITTEDMQLRTEDEEEMSEGPPEEEGEDILEDELFDAFFPEEDSAEETQTPPAETQTNTRREKLKKRLKKKKKEKKKGESGGTKENKLDDLLLTPALIDSKVGLVIERSVVSSDIHNTEKYTNMENQVVAISTGEPPAGPAVTDQDYVNHIATKLNISVGVLVTPMSVQDDLTTGQRKVASNLDVDGVLGKLAGTGADISMVTEAMKGGDNNPISLELHRNNQWALPVIQEFINISAQSGFMDRVTEKATGNQKRPNRVYPDQPDFSRAKLKAIIKKIKNDPESVPDRIKRYVNSLRKKYLDTERPTDVAPMYRFGPGMLAKVTIFQGYELDADGRFMIKKPIFESPKNWKVVFSDLQNKKTSSEVLLCRIEKEYDAELGIGTSAGLNIVDTNTYFLITRNANSLASKKAPSKKRTRAQNLQKRFLEAPPKIQKSIVIWHQNNKKR